MPTTTPGGAGYLDDARRLVRTAAAPPPAGEEQWRARLRDRVAALREAFGAHVTAADGLYADLCATAPHLTRPVSALRRDDARIAAAIDVLLGRSADAEPSSLRRWTAELAADLDRQRERGTRLLYEAYARDLGGET